MGAVPCPVSDIVVDEDWRCHHPGMHTGAGKAAEAAAALIASFPRAVWRNGKSQPLVFHSPFSSAVILAVEHCIV